MYRHKRSESEADYSCYMPAILLRVCIDVESSWLADVNNCQREGVKARMPDSLPPLTSQMLSTESHVEELDNNDHPPFLGPQGQNVCMKYFHMDIEVVRGHCDQTLRHGLP